MMELIINNWEWVLSYIIITEIVYFITIKYDILIIENSFKWYSMHKILIMAFSLVILSTFYTITSVMGLKMFFKSLLGTMVVLIIIIINALIATKLNK